MRLSSRTLVAFGLLAVLVCTLWVFWPGVYGPFLFDDEPNLKNLAHLNGRFDRQSIGIYLSLFNGVPGRPLAALSFLINDFSWPSEPLGFKITNLWIHLLNGVLVFGLGRTLATAYRGDCTKDHPTDAAVALGCAAIWLLSPIQISTVFLTVQRMAELAATFMFAGLWAYIAIALRARNYVDGLLALVALGLGTIFALLCKENGILAPVLALVLHVTLLRSSLHRLPDTASRTLRYGIVTTVVLLVAAFTWKWTSLTSFASRDYTMWERVMTQGRVLLDYARLIAFPDLTGSSLYNDDFPISKNLLSPATTLPALLVVLGALAASLALMRRKPLFSFGVLWFLTAHALESTVFPLEMYFEHRNYVPLFGPALAITLAISRLKVNFLRPVLMGAGMWSLIATVITHEQAKVWGNEGLLAVVWHSEHPNSLRAQQQYASYLFKTGRSGEAHAVLASAAENGISPVNTELQALTIACNTGQPIPEADVKQVTTLLRTEALTPGTAMVLARLRSSVQDQKCTYAISPDTWLHMTQVVLGNRRGNGIWRMLLVERTELYLWMDELDSAVHELDIAYGNHTDPRIAFYAAALLASAGRYDEARTWAERPRGRNWSWKRWLAQTDHQANQLIEAINESQARAQDSEADKP